MAQGTRCSIHDPTYSVLFLLLILFYGWFDLCLACGGTMVLFTSFHCLSRTSQLCEMRSSFLTTSWSNNVTSVIRDDRLGRAWQGQIPRLNKCQRSAMHPKSSRFGKSHDTSHRAFPRQRTCCSAHIPECQEADGHDCW